MSEYSNNPLFKHYLITESDYRGGKSRKEVGVDSKPVYKLSSNENLLGSSPKALEAIQRNIHKLNEYSEYSDDSMREALVGFFRNELEEDQFMVTNGGLEFLQMVMRAFLGQGTECIYSNPAFGPYGMFAQRTGADVIDIPLQRPDWSLNVDGILAAITDRTRMIILTSPNNPTGTYIPKNVLDRLIDSIPDHVVVLLDEVYYHFAQAEDFSKALPYVKAGKNVIGLHSFSKAYGLAGIRMAYAYTTKKLCRYLRYTRRPFMMNTLSMEAAVAALGDYEFIQQTVDLVRTEKPRFYAALEDAGIKHWKSEANFILMEPEMECEVFVQQMLENGVMVRHVANFGAPGCVRVTIGTKDANDTFFTALSRIKTEVV